MQVSARRELQYEHIVASLASAYLQLGGLLLQGGRFTKALQHFKQGVLLFQGVRAAAGTAACYCTMGALFMQRNAALDAARHESLLERESNSQQSACPPRHALCLVHCCRVLCVSCVLHRGY